MTSSPMPPAPMELQEALALADEVSPDPARAHAALGRLRDELAVRTGGVLMFGEPPVETIVTEWITRLPACGVQVERLALSQYPDWAENLVSVWTRLQPAAEPTSAGGQGWSGWATQYPGKMPRLCGAREIAELNYYPEEGQRLLFLTEAAAPAGDEVAQHPDGAAVDRFAIAMKEKLAAARAKGRSGWNDPAQCSASDLSRMLCEHVAKGDPRDVANFCMMLHQRGEAIETATQEVLTFVLPPARGVDLELAQQLVAELRSAAMALRDPQPFGRPLASDVAAAELLERAAEALSVAPASSAGGQDPVGEIVPQFVAPTTVQLFNSDLPVGTKLYAAAAGDAAPYAGVVRVHVALRDALQYVGQRSDGDLDTLAERAETWMRESRCLIDLKQKTIDHMQQRIDSQDAELGELRRATPAPAAVPVAQDVPELFVQWLEREMPGGTVIGRPSWWAPKIVRALRNAERGVLGGCNG